MPYSLIPDEFPVLRGDGLVLRALSEEDLPAWSARLADVEAASLAGDPVTSDPQVVVDGLAHHHAAFRSKEALRWAIVPDDVRYAVGSIGLVELDAVPRRASVGAAIDRAQWGRGIGTRAGRLVLEYAFVELELLRVEAVVLARNARVIRVLEKLGFELVSAAPSGRGIAGDDEGSRLYQISRAS